MLRATRFCYGRWDLTKINLFIRSCGLVLVRIRIFRIQGFAGLDVLVDGNPLHSITEIFIETSSNRIYQGSA